MRMHKVVKQMIVVLGLLMFVNTSMANTYETIPLRADNTVVNIFHSVNGRPTIAKDYFVKKVLTQTELSRGYNPEVYELRKCPDGATSCNGREIHLQDF